jgi:hypothetical protein
MTHLRKLIVGVCLFGYGTTIIAQTAIPASGSDWTASYSLGQVVYTKNTGTNGSSSQGVQQPYEISVITAIDETKDILLEFLVYPNPATYFLIVIQGYKEIKSLNIKLK